MNTRIICVSIVLVLSLIAPCMAADAQDSMNTAGALYSQSVDLANEGKYQQALDAADKALAMNVTALTALIQSNRAGILVMLNRNDEAITAADEALAVQGNLTTVHSIAWYNKGNALRALGRTAEAKEAYNNAYALDNTLVPPNLGPDLPATTVTVVTTAGVPTLTTVAPATTSQPAPAPTKSPLSPVPVIGALGIMGVLLIRSRKN